MSQRQRILFFAEAVTLAHIVRPLVLAQTLDPERYEIHFACAEGFDHLFTDTQFQHWSIHTIPAQQFITALAKGKYLYDYQTLSNYIENDLKVIDAVSPDLIVGDFRLSLAVSAPLRQVPYIAICNAHWSPYSSTNFPLPDHPLIALTGLTIANVIFQLIRPLVFKLHAQPLSRLRRQHRLPVLANLCDAYTCSDYTLYADTPELMPTDKSLPDHHEYIGPIIWSPAMSLPEWWHELDDDKPIIYVTLGSSGKSDLLPDVIKVLSELPVSAMIATAGRIQLNKVPKNIYVADYLPGTAAAKKADLVICNGGSATAYQALSEGVPVLGIAANMDQYLTMGGIVRLGAGLLLRAGRTNQSEIELAINSILGDGNKIFAAKKIKSEFSEYNLNQQFQKIINKIID